MIHVRIMRRKIKKKLIGYQDKSFIFSIHCIVGKISKKCLYLYFIKLSNEVIINFKLTMSKISD
jgi:hypothetical protein